MLQVPVATRTVLPSTLSCGRSRCLGTHRAHVNLLFCLFFDVRENAQASIHKRYKRSVLSMVFLVSWLFP